MPTIIMVLLIIAAVIAILYLFSIAPRIPGHRVPKNFYEYEYAHRGYHNISLGIAENSMSAFSRAIERGYAIELDLHLTSDGEVVVFHDDNLKRICGVDSAIWEHTYEELRQLRLQGTDERIPLFTDVLKLVDGRVPLLIELKLPTRNMTLCREAWRILRNYDGPFLIQSFNTFGLRWFRRHAPRIPRGQLSSDLTRERHHSESKVSYIPCVLGKYLLCNALGRPDFISYRYSCSHNLSFWLNRKLFRAGSAVWTIRGEALREKLATRFDMIIMEEEPTPALQRAKI